MADKGFLVVGGSGFMGRALQRAVMDEGLGDAYTFACNERTQNIPSVFKTIRADLTQREAAKPFERFKSAIFVAGNSNQLAANKEPWRDLEQNVSLLLNFARHFRGQLVLLSCQAVYQGLEGEVPEFVDHVPNTPFGLSKAVEETYAKHLVRVRWLDGLWIHRLLYAFGPGEPERSLIPMCDWAARTKGKVHIRGGGNSFMNPLSSRFVAQVLLQTADALQEAPSGFSETTNLSHPTRLTAEQVVRVLNGARRFEYEVDDTPEEVPVKFYGKTEKMRRYLKEWDMDFPDAKEELREHFLDLR